MKQLFFLIFLSTTFFAFAQNTQQDPQAFKVEIIGEGQPLLFIPGLACSGTVWEETVAAMAETYECHILTLAGFAGQDPLAEQKNFLPQIQQSIIEYITDTINEKPVIIGHSLGGFLAMKIASEHPEQVKGIVVVDAYPAMAKAINPAATDEQVQQQALMMKSMMINTPDSLFRQSQMMGLRTMMNDPQRLETVVEWSVQSHRNTVAQAMYELMTSDIRNQLGNISCPVLILGSWYAGKNYGLTRESVYNTFETQTEDIENCTIKIAQTARHFIMYDEFDWFLNELKSFLVNEQ